VPLASAYPRPARGARVALTRQGRSPIPAARPEAALTQRRRCLVSSARRSALNAPSCRSQRPVATARTHTRVGRDRNAGLSHRFALVRGRRRAATHSRRLCGEPESVLCAPLASGLERPRSAVRRSHGPHPASIATGLTSSHAVFTWTCSRGAITCSRSPRCDDLWLRPDWRVVLQAPSATLRRCRRNWWVDQLELLLSP
jgi:hypothetical protein